MAQTSVELVIEEIKRRVYIIQSEPQTMARELMIDNLSIDLDKYVEMHKEETLRFVRTMPRETGVTQEGQSYVQYDAEAHYTKTYNK